MQNTNEKESWEDVFDKAWVTSYGKIIYGEIGFLTTDAGEPRQLGHKDNVRDGEVIGNIYENKELLK